MKSEYSGLGFTENELMSIESFCEDSSDRVTGLYIEARRRIYYAEFFQYLYENDDDSFFFDLSSVE